MEYIGGPKPDGCIFCEPETPVADRERLIVYRGQNVMVMLNRYPYTNGHLMVAPYLHVSRLSEVASEIRHELIGCLAASEKILEETYRTDGLNLGANFGAAAGAGFVEHVHFHLVPRWLGDANFMTAVGEIRVIPEHLERTYDRLAPLFAEVG
jgi:ATP adenylyltransferase